jgi:hypothetical protein
MSDIDAVVVDSLKALEPERPIREADIRPIQFLVGNTINSEQKTRHTARLPPTSAVMLQRRQRKQRAMSRNCGPAHFTMPHSILAPVRNLLDEIGNASP